MRVDFTKSVTPILEKDPSSVFITGDLGYAALEDLRTRLGDRFLNAGVAEQNMIGVAAGIALSGLRPWVYSIAPFATYRCFEQIRNDLCLHRLPVRIVGNGGGYTYGIMGATHHALEDLGALKGLPNMTLYFPGVGGQLAACVDSLQRQTLPAYLRLAISGFAKDRPAIQENPVTLTRLYQTGTRTAIVAIGHAVQVALTALEREPGLDACVVSFSKYPFDWEQDAAVLEQIARCEQVLVLDEHYFSGSIAESFLAQSAQRVDLPTTTVITARYDADQRYGSAKYLLTQAGLTPEAVLQCARRKRAA